MACRRFRSVNSIVVFVIIVGNMLKCSSINRFRMAA